MFRLEFVSQEHEQAFENVLDVTNARSDYFSDDKFYMSMIYILTCDFIRPLFDRITYDTDELFEIDYNADISVFSSTEKFMITYALKLYFSSVENDYDFAYWFYQLSNENQQVMLNSLKFLQH